MEPNNKFVSQKMETAAQQLAAQTAAAAIKENSNSVNENSAPPTPSTPSVIVDPMDVLAAAAAKSPTAVVNGTQPSLTTFSDTVKPVPTEVKSPALLSAKPPTEQPVVKTMPTPPQAPVGAPVVTVPAAPVPVPATTTAIVPPSATTTATPAAVSLTATPVPTTSQPSTAASEPPATITPAPPATTTTPAPPATTTTPAPPATTTTPAPPTTTTPAPPATTTTPAPPTTTTPAAPPATTTTSEPPAQENTLGSTETKTHDSSGALPTETTNATSPPQVEKDLNGTSKVTQQESTTTMDVDTPDREPKQSIGSDVGSTAPETTTSQISTPAPVNEKPPAATPAAQPVLRPALRGTYSVGHDGIAEWEGKWGMDDAAFEPGGFVSPFRYRFVKHATPEESETKKIANPKAAAAGLAAPVPPVPEDQKLPLDLRDSFFSGHFIMRPRGVPVKIEERHLFFHFEKKDGSDEVLTVDGQGRNKFGVFVLEGELTVATRQLNVYRRYLPKGKKGGRAKATPRARKSLGNVTPLANAGVLPNPLATALSTGSIPRGLDSDAMVFHPRRPERLRRVPSHLTENDGTNPLGKIANIVHTMMEKDKQSFFCYPVDPVALNIPTYPDIIKEPMDLGTVANNIAEKLYDTELEVVHDVRLTYENAMKFNPASHAIHQIAKDYLKQFDNLFTNLVKEREREAEKQAAKAKKAKESVKAKTPTVTAPKKRKSIGGKKDGKKKKTKKKRSKAVFSSDDDSDADSSSDDSSDSSSDESSDDDSSDDETPKKRKKSSKKKKKKKKGKKDDEVARLKAELRSLKKKVEKKERRESVTEVNHTVSAPPTKKRKHIERPLSYQEKHRLTLDIQKLPEDKIQKIISMIQESGAPLDGDDNEVELDIDALETPALRKLQKFVRQCLGK